MALLRELGDKLVKLGTNLLAALIGFILVQSFSLAQTNDPPFQCPEPNFSMQSGDLFNSCSDILNGERILVPIDDLAVTQMSPGGAPLNTEVFVLESDDSRIINQSNFQITGGAPSDAGFNKLAFGRFVNRDIFATTPNAAQGVVVGPNNNDAGNLCPNTGAGDKLVMSFFRSSGQFECFAMPTSLPFDGIVWSVAVADFNRDGLDDLFVNYSGDGAYRIFTFNNAQSTDFDEDIVVTSELTGLRLVDVTTGDFDGDGILEIAGVQRTDGRIEVVVLKLDFEQTGALKGIHEPIIIHSAHVGVGFDVPQGQTMAITAGDFDTNSPFVDELVIAAAVDLEFSLISASLNAFGLNLDASCSIGTICELGAPCPCINNASSNLTHFSQNFGTTRPTTPLRLKTKRMPNGPDIAAFGMNAPIDGFTTNTTFYNISVLDFTDTGANPLDFNLISFENLTTNVETVACLHDIAIGNFAPFGTLIPDIRVTALFTNSESTDCSSIFDTVDQFQAPRMGFFKVEGSSLVQTGELPVHNIMGVLPLTNGITTYLNLEAGDIFGRSILLGDPTKVVINQHVKPAVVIKSPPLHVTALAPPEGIENNVDANDSTVIGNIISAYPDVINSEFGINESEFPTFNNRYSTDYTLSAQQGSESNLFYSALEDLDAIFTFGQIIEQIYNNKVPAKYNQYVTPGDDRVVLQRFGDAMLSAQNRLNIWSYPIVGPNGSECVPCLIPANCPGVSGCAPGTAPLIFNVSAPDVINTTFGETTALEWYQPVEVMGNALTYPWTLAQLMHVYPGFTPISTLNDEDFIGTDNSPKLVPFTVNNSLDTGFDSAVEHSFNTPESVSGKARIFSGQGVDPGAEIEYNESDSFSSLYELDNFASTTEGFTINKEIIPANPQVGYPYRPHIFIQDFFSGLLPEKRRPPDNFPVLGTLYLGFEANTASESEELAAGPWWSDTYNQGSDIAFNLPGQWDWFNQGDSLNPKQFYFANKDDSADLFYYMKGFFAIPTMDDEAVCPSSLPFSDPFDSGPQRAAYTSGDLILLCLRVYNLSLRDFDENAQPKMRIYRREWDHNLGDFVPGSESELVDEILLPQIPKAGAADFGNGTSSDPPNWIYAGTVFDTSKVSAERDTFWKFWAVTWIEDDSGVLIEEIGEQGLNSIPPQEIDSHTSIDIEPFSNNVGLYNQVYAILQAANEAPSEDPPVDPGDMESIETRELTGSLFIQSFNQLTALVGPGARAELELVISNSDGDSAHDVTILYFDGDPDEGGVLFAQGGRLFDMEIFPQVPASDFITVRNSFLPRACGVNNVFVRTITDDGTTDLGLVQIELNCSGITITKKQYNPELQQVIVRGFLAGLPPGGVVQLLDDKNPDPPLAEIPEEDLGEDNGNKTFTFLLEGLVGEDVPCLVVVKAGELKETVEIENSPTCDTIVVPTPTPAPPTPEPSPSPLPTAPPTNPPPVNPTPPPTPTPTPTPIPPLPPFDPGGENVVPLGEVVIVSPQSSKIGQASQVPPGCPAELDGEIINYPLGFFTYEVTGITPGSTVEVGYVLPRGMENVNRFFKFGPTPDNPEPHCYDFSFDGVTGAQFTVDGDILVTFVDGLRGDSDLTVNGIITDPGGPASVTRDAPENPQIGVGDCSLARSSQPPSALVSLLIPLFAGLFAGVRMLRRRSKV